MNRLLNLSKYSPEKLHRMGSNAREKDKHLKALCYLDNAIVGYQLKGNYSGVIDALKDRVLTWKHYFLLTTENMYAILAKKDAEAMLEITKEKHLNEKLSTSFFRMGEVEMLFCNYKEAIKNYRSSIKYYRGSLSEKGDFRYHLGEALYKYGQKDEGERIMLQGLKEIKRGAKKMPNFLINVWLTGCHIRLAELLREDNPCEAEIHLEKANKIVESDDRLVIRKRQLKQLREVFNKRVS